MCFLFVIYCLRALGEKPVELKISRRYGLGGEYFFKSLIGDICSKRRPHLLLYYYIIFVNYFYDSFY